ncbi:MAG TPA: hypothetical protein VJM33_06035 [Microthrixaceae bacterium]|nr:hypothetical protein [Microthrixaceae bacterium]
MAATGTPRTTADHVEDLRDLVVGYAKQETVDPLRALQRYAGFGAGGSLCVGSGCVFLLLALLRGLQSIDALVDPSEPWGGTWSFVPYLVTAVVGAGMIGLAILGISRAGNDPRRAR